jgi:hypothetical protein
VAKASIHCASDETVAYMLSTGPVRAKGPRVLAAFGIGVRKRFCWPTSSELILRSAGCLGICLEQRDGALLWRFLRCHAVYRILISPMIRANFEPGLSTVV